MQHMAKMKYLKLIDENVVQTIENDECYKKYYQKHLQEIESMETAEFYNDLHACQHFISEQKDDFGVCQKWNVSESFE